MNNILLTNDDGYESPGFYPLLKELARYFSVTTVAPTSENSWIGKSISKRKDLSLNKVKLKDFSHSN